MIRNIFLYFFYCILRFSITFAKEWCITISQLGILKNSKFFDFYGLKKTSLWICPNILVRQSLTCGINQNWRKIKQESSNTLRLKYCYWKIIRFFYPRFHPEIIKISKRCTNNNYACLNEVVWLMTMKARLKMKNRLHR